jgi:hypothetical protein
MNSAVKRRNNKQINNRMSDAVDLEEIPVENGTCVT